MGNSVCWYGHVLRREDGHVLRRALDFEIDGQRKKGRLKRTLERQVEEESVNVVLRREDALCRLKWIVRLPPGCNESNHCHFFGLLPDFKHWSISFLWLFGGFCSCVGLILWL